jgi:hypothetical protein
MAPARPAGWRGGSLSGFSFPILPFIVSAILFAPLASWLALRRARPWALWFVFGAALGPIATLLLVFSPPGRCPTCDTRSVGWPRSCTNCGLVFNWRSAGNESGTAAGPIAPAPASAGSTVVQPASALPAATPARGTRGTLRTATQSTATPPPPAVLDADEPGRRSATTLGQRATAVTAPSPRPAPNQAAPDALAIIGSGVFIGGSESLQIGSRYLLARVGSELHVLGPVHVSPAAVATRLRLDGVEPVLVADRLLIAPVPPGGGPDLAFGGVILEVNADAARELLGTRPRRSTST